MSEAKSRLAAIMFTDIVGYTATMGEDEQKAFALLDKNRNIQKPIVEKHEGEWIKEIGDGVLLKFNSAVDAVSCATEIQNASKQYEDLVLRIGIHLGDVTFDENDVFGDGVNVASRIQSVCDPGGIYLSESIEKAIRGRLNLKTQYLGELSFRNVNYDVRTYAVISGGFPIPKSYLSHLSAKSRSKKRSKLYLYGFSVLLVLLAGWYFFFYKVPESQIDKSGFSIAVLPFTNLSNDPNTKYFADGIMDEILTNLSKIDGLRVISKASTMRFGQLPIDMVSISSDLGVSHILIGSVYKDESNYRINTQLVQTDNETQIWAGKYDGKGKKTIDLLDSISLAISKALALQLNESELSKLKSNKTDNNLAYDYYLRSRHKNTLDSISLRKSIHLSRIAIEIDSTFSLPYLEIANSYRYLHWRYFDRNDSIVFQITRNLKKAYDLDGETFEYLMANGRYFYHVKSFYDSALVYYEKANKINKNSSDNDLALAFTYRRQGAIRKSTNSLLKGLPKDPLNEDLLNVLSENYNLLRMPDSSMFYIKKRYTINPYSTMPPILLLRTFYYITGDVNAAKDSTAKYLDFDNNINGSELHYALINLYIFERSFSLALELIGEEDLIIYNNHEGYFSASYFRGLTYYYLDSVELKEEFLQKNLLTIDNALLSDLNDSRLYSMKGLAHAYLGNSDLAIKNGTKGVELMPYSKDAWKNFHRVVDLARIYSLLDKEEEALDLIKYILDADFGYYKLLFKKDPVWDNMRDNEEFIQIVN